MAHGEKAVIKKNGFKIAIHCYRKDKDTLCCRYGIVKAGHVIHRGEQCVNLPAIRALALKAIKEEGESAGWSWDVMKKKVRRITNKVALKRVLRDVVTFASSPEMQKAAQFATGIYPPLGITYQQSVKLAKLVSDYREGVPKAEAKLVQIQKLANAGDVKAQKLGKAAMVLNKAADEGYDVSGWADKLKHTWLIAVPFRSPLDAKELDARNPKHVLRFLHAQRMRDIALGRK